MKSDIVLTESHDESTDERMSLDVLFPGKLARVNEVLGRTTETGYYETAYQSVPSLAFDSLEQLESLPILRKSNFTELQQKVVPFGGLMAQSSRPDYLFVSPGPIHEPGFLSSEYWRMERVMKAAGFVAGDVVHNTFSYHLTPGAWIFDAGSRALGCSTIPAGNASIDLQLHAIKHYSATCYVGTPDFLKKLIDGYAMAGFGTFPISKAVVSSGPYTPGLRQLFAQTGIEVVQCYATAELGCIAFEVPGSTDMLIDEEIVVEIVDPVSGRAMPFGEVGEVVVTTLRTDYPLIRFGTGDLSAFVTGVEPGKPTSIVGWLGRSDQAVKVRGMFIRPQQIESIRTGIHGLEKVRLVIDRMNEQDTAVLFCGFAATSAPADPDERAQQVANTLRKTCHLTINVSIVDESTLADDGKLIVDMR